MKSDYNKSMLRLGAVVVASASILGAASSMNAAPVAAPLPAAEDAEELSENEIAFNNDIAKIYALQEKLTDVLKTLEANYPTYEDGYAMANEINGKIAKMQEWCIDAFDAIGEGDVYVSPLTDAWEQEMDSDIDNILYQADQDRIAKNDAAYAKCINLLAAFQEEISSQCGDESLDYYPYLNRGQVESLYNEANNLKDEVDAEYEHAQEAGTFDMVIDDEISMFRGQLAQIVEKAQQAYEKVRVEKNAEAYGKCMTALSDFQQEFSAACGDESLDYYPYLNRGKVESLYNEILNLVDEVEAENRATEEAGVFSLSIDDELTMLRGQLNKIVDAAKAAKANQDAIDTANLNAYNEACSLIENLRTELAEAISPEHDYADVVNRGKVGAIESAIEEMQDEADAEWNNVKENGGNYGYTGTEDAYQIRAMIAKLVSDAQEAYRKALNTAAYDKCMEGIQQLRDEAAYAFATDTEYYSFLNRAAVESIDGEIEYLVMEIETEKTATANEGLFNFSFEDSANAIRGLIQKAVQDAEKAYNADRMEKNAKAYGDYMTELSLLQEELTDVVNNREYSAFVNRGLAESIYNEIELLYTDAEKYYEGVQEAGVFDLSIADDANAIRGAIEKLADNAAKAYEADRVEKNEKAYGDYMTELSLLQQELSYACIEGTDYYPFINRGLAESIYNELETLYEEAEKYYEGVKEAGWFDLSIADDANAIRGAIAKLVQDAQNAYERDRKDRNAEAYGKYMTTLSELQEELTQAVNNEEYSKFINRGVAESIYNELENLYNDAEKYYMGVEEAGWFDLNIDEDAHAIRAAIAKLIEKAQQAFDTDRREKNAEAYGKYMTELSLLQEELSTQCGDESLDYYKFLNRGKVEAIYNELETLYNDAEKYYMGVEEAGWFDLSIADDANAIRGAIAAVVEAAQKAYEGDRVAQNDVMFANWMNNVDKLQKELDEALAADNDYIDYINRGVAESIQNEIDELKAEGIKYYTGVVEAGHFDITNDDEYVAISGEINKMVETAAKAYNAIRVANNEKAYGEYMTELSNLQEELSAACGDESLDYYKYLNRGKVEAIYNELETLANDAEKYYEGVKEAGVFDLSIADDAAMIRGQIKAIVDQAKDIAADPNGHFNKIAYGNDITKLSEMQQSFTALWEEIQKTSPAFYESAMGNAMAENLYNELKDLNDACEAAYAATEGDADAIYNSPIPENFEETFAEGVAALQHMAQVFADNYAAMQEDAKAVQDVMAELWPLGDELDTIDSTWMDYEPALDLWNEISDGLNDMINKINEAYQASLKTGEFISPFSEAELDAAKAKMDELRELVQTNKQRVAENAEAYGNDVTKLVEMQQEYTALWEEMQKTSPDFYESAYGQAMAKNVYDIIADMHEAVENEYASVEKDGYYVSPITEAFEQDFTEAVDNLQRMAQVFADNYDAMLADNEAVDALDNEVFELGDKLDALDPEWMEIEEAAALGDEIRALIDALRADVLGAYQASLKTGEYISPIDEAAFADVREVMDNLYNLVKAHVEANRTDYNNRAFGAEFSLLSSLQEILSNTWNELVDAYYGFEEYGAAIALSTNLYDELQSKADAVIAEYEAVEAEGIYSPQLPYTFEQDILDGIEQLQALGEQYGVAWNEFQANGNTLFELNDQMRQYESQLDEEVPGWDANDEAMALDGEIWADINGLLNNINAAWQAFLKTGEYICPFDEEDITAIIVKMDELYRIGLETSVSTLDAIDADAEYYTLDGQKLSRPVRGMVNIVRKGDKVQKIFIK